MRREHSTAWLQFPTLQSSASVPAGRPGIGMHRDDHRYIIWFLVLVGWSVTENSNAAILHSASVDFWTFGQFWIFGLLDFWIFGRLDSFGLLDFWTFGQFWTFGLLYFWTFGLLDFCIFGLLDSFGLLDFWILGLLDSFGLLDFGTF